MIRRLYDWTMRLAARPSATYALSFISFVESSVFPIPPDVILIPMVLAERAKAWWFAFVCTVSSVAGAMLGYAIGALLYDMVAEPIMSFYGYAQRFEDFKSMYDEWGLWIVLFAGVTPFPFKVITIASGATGFNFIVFVLSAIAARGLRFFVVAAILYWLGPPIRDFIEKWLGLLFTLFMVLLIGGFVLIRYVI